MGVRARVRSFSAPSFLGAARGIFRPTLVRGIPTKSRLGITNHHRPRLAFARAFCFSTGSEENQHPGLYRPARIVEHKSGRAAEMWNLDRANEYV
jgi:hypothetical protein